MLLCQFFKLKSLTISCGVSCPPPTHVKLISTPCVPQISGDEFFADVVRDILLYVSHDLSDQVGSSLS